MQSNQNEWSPYMMENESVSPVSGGVYDKDIEYITDSDEADVPTTEGESPINKYKITTTDINNYNWLGDENRKKLEEQEIEEVTYIETYDTRENTYIAHNDKDTYRINLSKTYTNVISFELVSASIPKIEYNILEDNNYLEWQERNTSSGNITATYYIRIPIGKYDNTTFSSTLQTYMNTSSYINSYNYTNGVSYGGENGNTSTYQVNINSITGIISIELKENLSNSPTNSFRFLFSSGNYKLNSLSDVLGFNKVDTEWSNSPYKSIVGVLSLFAGKLKQITSDLLQESDEDSFISIYNSSSGVEIDTTTITSVDSNVCISSDEINTSAGNINVSFYTDRKQTGVFPFYLATPMYLNVHTKEFDSVQNGTLSRIHFKNDSNISNEIFTNSYSRRYFHPHSKLSHIELNFSRFGYIELDNKIIGKHTVVKHELQNKPISLQFEIVCLRRKSNNLKDYIIE